MDDEPRPTHFVDYQAVFSQALVLVGRGKSVPDALEACLRESYPLTYREMVAEAKLILSRLMQEREWGALRALRELADQAGLADEIRGGGVGSEEAPAGPAPRRYGAIADYPRIFALAQRKRNAGFSLEDALEMAVREIYPQTYRKVLETARHYIRLAASRRGEHELRALRELAEDPQLFYRLESHLPE